MVFTLFTKSLLLTLLRVKITGHSMVFVRSMNFARNNSKIFFIQYYCNIFNTGLCYNRTKWTKNKKYHAQKLQAKRSHI